MPYNIRKVEDKWKIVNTDRNEVVGTSDSKEDAEASIRARMANEFCDDDVKSFALQYSISYSDAYRMFELNSVGLLDKENCKIDIGK